MAAFRTISVHLPVLLLFLLSFLSLASARVTLLARNESFLDRAASFGPDIPSFHNNGEKLFTGFLLDLAEISNNTRSLSWNNHSIAFVADKYESHLDPTVDRKGCKAFPSPIHLPNMIPWIALVERGKCSFLDKVRAMQLSGAAAVVVGDNLPKAELTTMSADGDSSDITIPSIFISQLTYQYILYQMLTNPQTIQKPSKDSAIFRGLFVALEPDIYQTPVIDLLLILILSPILFVSAFYTIYAISQWVHRKKEIREMRKHISSIPTRIFCIDKHLESDPDTCAICLDDFTDNDELRILPCKHEFHIACIDPWIIERSRLCPICKKDVSLNESTPLLEP